MNGEGLKCAAQLLLVSTVSNKSLFFFCTVSMTPNCNIPPLTNHTVVAARRVKKRKGLKKPTKKNSSSGELVSSWYFTSLQWLGGLLQFDVRPLISPSKMPSCTVMTNHRFIRSHPISRNKSDQQKEGQGPLSAIKC